MTRVPHTHTHTEKLFLLKLWSGSCNLFFLFHRVLLCRETLLGNNFNRFFMWCENKISLTNLTFFCCSLCASFHRYILSHVGSNRAEVLAKKLETVRPFFGPARANYIYVLFLPQNWNTLKHIILFCFRSLGTYTPNNLVWLGDRDRARAGDRNEWNGSVDKKASDSFIRCAELNKNRHKAAN